MVSKGFIAYLKEQKTQKRVETSLKKMANFGKKFSCPKCLHKQTKSCQGNMPCGCEDFFDYRLNLSFKEITGQKKLFV
jgi:transcription elongation factor Elf1